MGHAEMLTQEQQDFHKRDGYLLWLPPIYTPEEIRRLNGELPSLLALLRPGETAREIRKWHESSTYLYEIVSDPKIHHLIENILGAEFLLLGKQLLHQGPIQ
jgi:hypothetical protein